MIVTLIILAVLILIIAGSTLEAVRDVEIRTRGLGDSFVRIELELEEIKKTVEEIRKKHNISIDLIQQEH